RAFYRTLAKTYTAHPALYQGDFRKLVSDNDDQIFAFTRKSVRPLTDEAVIIVNFSQQPFSGMIDFKNVSGAFDDIFGAGHIEFSGEKMKFDLKQWTYLVYIKQR
ncbi:alpha amylase C-terminal domain-containing protein, partial [candidate division KSB1 bacterium]|nr:alpha amylase C-terminal domain-containing protein [candidate division KSB1 bacterium]